MGKKISIIILILLSMNFISCSFNKENDKVEIKEEVEKTFTLQKNIPQVANLGRAKVIFNKSFNKEGYYLMYGRDDIDGRIRVIRNGEKIVDLKVDNDDICVTYLKIGDTVEFENCSNYFIQKEKNINEEDIDNYINKKFNI